MSASPSVAGAASHAVRCGSPCAVAVADAVADAAESESASESALEAHAGSPIDKGAALQWLLDAPVQQARPVAPVQPTGPLFDDFASDECASGFEDALLAMDAATVSSQKRMREKDVEDRRLLRKPLGEPFPFHESVAVLHAALKQVAVLCNTEVPAYFDLSTDPKRVELWVGQVIMASLRTQFEFGRAQERAHVAPRFSPATALEIMRCCTRMNQLLEVDDPGR